MAALKWMPLGGLYVGGGIAPKFRQQLTPPDGAFLQAFWCASATLAHACGREECVSSFCWSTTCCSFSFSFSSAVSAADAAAAAEAFCVVVVVVVVVVVAVLFSF